MFRRHFRASMLAIVVLAALGAWTSAQVYVPQPVNPPIVVSGPDVGFRIESRRGEAIHGRVVVKINGQWTEVTVSDSNPMRRIGTN